MKKILGVLLIFMAILGFTSCNNDNNHSNDVNDSSTSHVITTSNILIAYFSCTNTTETIAKHIEAETKGTLYEIIPEVPYTEDDLKYYTD